MHMPSAFPILFGIIHVPFDSFISQNEGNAEPGGRRCALLSGHRIPWMAELAVSKCDLAWFCTGRRMLSLFGHSLLCGLWASLKTGIEMLHLLY
jgi:hypothetical protein